MRKPLGVLHPDLPYRILRIHPLVALRGLAIGTVTSFLVGFALSSVCVYWLHLPARSIPSKTLALIAALSTVAMEGTLLVRAHSRMLARRGSRRSRNAANTTDRCLKFLQTLIPRHNREAILGDIWEDVVEFRAEGWKESHVRLHILWQLAVIVACRCRGIYRLAIFAWLAAKVRALFCGL